MKFYLCADLENFKPRLVLASIENVEWENDLVALVRYLASQARPQTHRLFVPFQLSQDKSKQYTWSARIDHLFPVWSVPPSGERGTAVGTFRFVFINSGQSVTNPLPGVNSRKLSHLILTTADNGVIYSEAL